jgi:DNA-binding transcriptional regulator YiaG
MTSTLERLKKPNGSKRMAGHHPFSELRGKMSPEAQKRAAVKAKLLAEEMDLAELRRAFEMSQEELARTLGVGQAAVAKIERRADMYLSTLNRVITAMGGELRIVAQFGGRDVCIKHVLLEGGRFGGTHGRNHSHSRKKVIPVHSATAADSLGLTPLRRRGKGPAQISRGRDEK